MKVILKKDVKDLGNKGEVKEVTDGFARNFLFPRGLAVAASEGGMKELSEQRQRKASRLEQEEKKAREIAKKLSGLVVKVPGRVGEKGRLFGSITSKEIAEHLAGEHHLEVDRRKLELKEPIKAPGTYPVTVRVYPGIQAQIIVEVTGT